MWRCCGGSLTFFTCSLPPSMCCAATVTWQRFISPSLAAFVRSVLLASVSSDLLLLCCCPGEGVICVETITQDFLVHTFVLDTTRGDHSAFGVLTGVDNLFLCYVFPKKHCQLPDVTQITDLRLRFMLMFLGVSLVRLEPCAALRSTAQRTQLRHT
jgi:hypothetical protein